MKARASLGAGAVFALLLVAVYWVHVRYLDVDVLLYSAVEDALAATGVVAVLLATTRLGAALGSFEKALLCVIFLLSGYAAAISVPTVIDRSLSFYILEKLQQRGGGIRLDRFEDVFTREYLHEHRLMDIRLTEQQASGTVVIENGCVKLTDKGDRLARFSRFFRAEFLPRHRLIAGRYTDDLVDPFRNGIAAPDYTCH